MPVEEILELHPKLAFAIEDLRALLSVDNVLGAIWFTEKELRVDVRRRPSRSGQSRRPLDCSCRFFDDR